MALFLENLFKRCHRFRILIGGLSLLTIVVCASGFFKNTSVDNSLDVWFDPADAELINYQKYLTMFGSDRRFYVKIPAQTSDISQAIKLKKLTQYIQSIPNIHSVVSAANSPVISASKNIISQRFYDDWLLENKSINDLKETNPAFKKWISRDNNSFLLEVTLKTPLSPGDTKAVFSALEKLKHDYPIVYSGIPVLDNRFNELVYKDQFILFPASVVFAFFVLYWFVGCFRVSLIVAFVQTLVLIILLRLSQFLGYPLTIISGLACPLVVCVSVLNTAYLCQSLETSFKDWANKVRRLLRPAIYTELTTIAGVASFGTSGVPPLFHLSVLASVGIFLVLFATLFIIPSLIGIQPASKKRQSNKIDLFLLKTTHFLSDLSLQHPKKILLGSLSLMIFCGVGFAHTKIQTRFENYFSKADPVAQMTREMSQEASLEWVFSGEPAWMLSQAGFKKVESFHSFFYSEPRLESVVSPVNHFDLAAKLLDLPEPVIWTDALIEQVHLLFSPLIEESSLMTEDAIRITMLIKASSLEDLHQLGMNLKSKLENTAPQSVTFFVTSYEYMLSLLHKHLGDSQKQSFYISVIIITVMMTVLTRNILLGLLSLIPNLMPVLIAFGLMGWLRIPLDIATILVAALAIGVTVDDTIHFWDHFSKNRYKYSNTEEALRGTIRDVGVIMAKSSIVLTAGFLIFTLGQLKPTILFGLVSAATFLLAFICEYLVTPALIITVLKKQPRF